MRRFGCVCLALVLFAVVGSASALASDRVNLKVASEAFDGDSVYVEVTLSKPLASNEVVSILANGEIAAMIAADNGVGLKRFDLHVRLLSKESTVSATLAVDGELVDFWDKKVDVKEVGHLYDRLHDPKIYLNGIFGNGDAIWVGFDVITSRENYLKGFKVRTSIGRILVNGSPYLGNDLNFHFHTVKTFDLLDSSDLDFWNK